MPLTGDDGKPYPFLRHARPTTTMTDARDDRYRRRLQHRLGSTAPSDTKKPEPQPAFRIAYIARAVTTGTFVMPAGVVEDMYAPAIQARTTMGSVTIKP